ncbi:unnamed protein product [Linum trigynum]|uniref:Uncharacterized protein n=1 Tax=Linum trigynum TaxID=586398 RepID=A0AAV2CG31_9ROSI
MSLRANGFPQFDFQLPSMAGSGADPSRDHASPFEPSYEIDDESEEYESDDLSIAFHQSVRSETEVPPADRHMSLLGFMLLLGSIETMQGVSTELHSLVRDRVVLLMWERPGRLEERVLEDRATRVYSVAFLDMLPNFNIWMEVGWAKKRCVSTSLSSFITSV